MNWKEVFIEKYFSESQEDYNEGLKIKSDNMPNSLYRYRSINNLDFLKNEICRGEIFLSHPKAFNDPYDTASILSSKNPYDYYSDKEKAMDIFSKRMSKEQFEKIFLSANWGDSLSTFVAERIPGGNIEDKKNFIQRKDMELLEETHVKAVKEIGKSNRIACFSETSKSLPMWAHYANNHYGICIEYDTRLLDHPYLRERLFPVIYTNQIPDILSMFAKHQYPKHTTFDYSAIHKLNDWSYEKEWRLILSTSIWKIGEHISDEFWEEGKITKIGIPRKIILGSKTEEEIAKIIYRFANQNNISVVKMKCTEFGLEEKKYEYT